MEDGLRHYIVTVDARKVLFALCGKSASRLFRVPGIFLFGYWTVNIGSEWGCRFWRVALSRTSQ